MRHQSRYRALTPACLAGLLLGACSKPDDDPGGTTAQTTAPPVLDGVEITSTRTSPALVRFNLRDPEGDPADVRVMLRRADGTTVDVTFVEGSFTSPETGETATAPVARKGLAAPAEGASHYRLWDFAADLGLADAGLAEAQLELAAQATSESDGAPAAPTPVTFTVGNEAPALVPLVVGQDVAAVEKGIVPLPLRVHDSLGDAVEIKVEYQLLDDAACEGFFPARDADLPALDAPMPEFQLAATTQPMPEGGSGELEPVEFLWNTVYSGPDVPETCDLFDKKGAVRLRITLREVLADPDDEPLTAVVFALENGFEIDNEPIVTDPPDGPGDEDPPGEDPGGEDPGGEDPPGEDPDPETDPDEWIRQLLAHHPWIEPFLADPVVRRVVLEASRMSPAALAVADVEGDGDLDLFWADAMSDQVKIFFQTAPGVFDPTPMRLGGPQTTQGPVSVVAVDLDGDRDVDVAAGNLRGDDLTLFFQTRPGRFSEEVTILRAPGLLRPLWLRAEDVERDGDNDLLVGDERLAVTAIFVQTSPGQFRYTPPQ